MGIGKLLFLAPFIPLFSMLISIFFFYIKERN